MEKKFIYKRDLGEIMEEIAEEALKHADKMSTYITFRSNEMTVQTVMNKSPYSALSSSAYEIIDEIEDSTDAMDRIFGDALVALEKLTVIKTEETNI
jgi:vacuolar-type H+-ATPase subunit I/STV1